MQIKTFHDVRKFDAWLLAIKSNPCLKMNLYVAIKDAFIMLMHSGSV